MRCNVYILLPKMPIYKIETQEKDQRFYYLPILSEDFMYKSNFVL